MTTAGKPEAEAVQERDIHVPSFFTNISAELLQTFAHLIDEGQIRVTIGSVFPLSEASQAQEMGQQGHGRGRIVLHIV